MSKGLAKLPKDLPVPRDDGACKHLLGLTFPRIILPSTNGDSFDISMINTRFVILYFFPMMGISERSLPSEWDNIPGARGCTPQNISMNEGYEELQKFDVTLIGVSTQIIDELSKLSLTNRFSPVTLSDIHLKLEEKINIPTFQTDNKTFYKRLTLILKESKIVRVFYPVFPPDKHIFEILDWLENNS